ncbi:MAG: toll/interleukin-1 receptor domain-containing protein [Chloroflexota bacterium]
MAINSKCEFLALTRPEFELEDIEEYLPEDIAGWLLRSNAVYLSEGYFSRLMNVLQNPEIEGHEEVMDRHNQQHPALNKVLAVLEETLLYDTSKKLEIFISYNHKDWLSYAEPLVNHLRSQGLNVWVDQHLLEGGDDWLDRVNEALERCYCLVLCVSPEALNSKYVKMEYRYYIRENKFILPLICREAKLPVELAGIQFLAYSDFPAIVQTLKKHERL